MDIKESILGSNIISIDLNSNTFNNNSKAYTPSDALFECLNELGFVDIDYICKLCKLDRFTVLQNLNGAIYTNPSNFNPEKPVYLTSDEYLSGNLLKKLDEANQANKIYNHLFDENIDAIKKKLPKRLSASEIYITLGSPWVPSKYIHQFIMHILYENENNSPVYRFNHYIIQDKVDYDKAAKVWHISNRWNYGSKVFLMSNKYSTKRIDVLELIEKSLNLRTPILYDNKDSLITSTKKTKVINEEETIKAIDKQNQLIEDFRQWIWSDPIRKKHLENIYIEKYGSIQTRTFNGEFLKLSDVNPNIKLFSYQKNAIARIIFSPNTLLSHDVGAGKTYIMIIAGMELKRLGKRKKILYVVPNNILAQWKGMFLNLYPSAKLLVIDSKTFNKSNRLNCLRSIQNDTYDAVLMSASCFDLIPISKKTLMSFITEKIDQAKANDASLSIVLKLWDKYHKLDKEIKEDDINNIYLDDLGVDQIFVDEAHNYKNIPLEVHMSYVKGVNFNGSKKAEHLLNFTKFLHRKNNGSGIVFATGTPITNSVSECFAMQYYLQPGELQLLGLNNFDKWAGMFCERQSEFEIDIDTSTYRIATRFSRFHNLPELNAIFSNIADFHPLENCEGLPQEVIKKNIIVPQSKELAEYLKNISKRANLVRNHKVNSKEDNLLKITTDGRKAALDIRLIDNTIPYSNYLKIYHLCETVSQIYFDEFDSLGTQLIFCDTSTMGGSVFNVYSEIKYRLICLGVNHNDIAFVQEGKSETERRKIYKKLKKAEIRILIGSTFTLGQGVNVQDHLFAIHHLDVPWRPADMRQREGRIIRQGNINKTVYIYRYIADKSFDAYSWQLLEIKQKFIDSLLSGQLIEREGSDISDTVLDYAEVKSLAVGNPLIKERVMTENELNRYRLLERNENLECEQANDLLAEMPLQLCEIEEKILNAKKDAMSITKSIKDESDYNSLSNVEKEKINIKRKEWRENFQLAVSNNVLSKTENFYCNYRGFRILMPANMLIEKPYIYLENNGKYYVELSNDSLGNQKRIDNFINSFSKNILNNFINRHDELIKLQTNLEYKIKHKKTYTKMINSLKSKLIKIDHKLGVSKYE